MLDLKIVLILREGGEVVLDFVLIFLKNAAKWDNTFREALKLVQGRSRQDMASTTISFNRR